MWRFAAAQSIGTSHLRTEIPCQDKLACKILPCGSLMAVVADGAGTASMGERGAEITVNSVVTHVTHCLAEKRLDLEALLREAAALARQEIETEASREANTLRDYASTLLAVIITPVGGAALQLGDGAIVVSNGNDEWSWVFWPQRGEYANTTYFLTDDDALDQMGSETFSGFITEVALMSDGLEPLALHYASRTAHNPFFNGMFRPLLAADGCGEIEVLSASLGEFLSMEQVRSRTDDDVSLILASRRNFNQSR